MFSFNIFHGPIRTSSIEGKSINVYGEGSTNDRKKFSVVKLNDLPNIEKYNRSQSASTINELIEEIKHSKFDNVLESQRWALKWTSSPDKDPVRYCAVESDLLLAWLRSDEVTDFNQTSSDKKKNKPIDDFPSICPSCSGKVYIGFMSIDHQNKNSTCLKRK